MLKEGDGTAAWTGAIGSCMLGPPGAGGDDAAIDVTDGTRGGAGSTKASLGCNGGVNPIGG